MDIVGFMKDKKEFKDKKIRKKIYNLFRTKEGSIDFRFLEREDFRFFIQEKVNVDFLKEVLKRKYIFNKLCEKKIQKVRKAIKLFFGNSSTEKYWKLCILNGSIIPEESNYQDSPYQVKIFNGNHSSILRNFVEIEDPFSYITQFISNKVIYIRSQENSYPRRVLYIFNFSYGIEENRFSNINHCRYFLEILQNSKIKIIEVFLSINRFSCFTNSLFTFSVEENSTLQYDRVNLENDQNLHHSYSGASLKRNSFLKYNNITLGSKDSQNIIKICLNGYNSRVNLNGLSLQKQSEKNSNYISIDHICPFGKSEQIYNMVTLGKSSISLKNNIQIFHQSPFSYGKILNRNLIFGKNSKVFSSPHLNIYNKESSCSHGVTVGNIDKSLIFYLCSRGISEDKSKEMIINSFFEKTLKKIHVKCVKDKIRQTIKNKILKGL
ncbi:SufD family Fe-S cluster assembly protein [Candidatus Riesia pediculicola]|nr:SufD family Fe-S cluster assembly protein [Candidatus Riesia pediculicola]ARC53663.1 hypothetical protein AOE55_00630 [Candidatus Riesia pediculicola]QOJ86311.1 SufD family Fe-S cluster assembly protein [Candidatus Riesia pediculicola]